MPALALTGPAEEWMRATGTAPCPCHRFVALLIWLTNQPASLYLRAPLCMLAHNAPLLVA